MVQPQTSVWDKRRFQRFRVLSDVDVYFQFEEERDRLKAKLSDISYPFMGLKLVSSHAIPEQTTITLELIADREESIAQFRGIVAWSRGEERGEPLEKSTYQAGIYVGADSTETQRILDTQISHLIPAYLRDLYSHLKDQYDSLQTLFNQQG